MNWENKRVLVTGAAGFIGSHLTEALVKRGAKVKAFIHYNSRNDWGNLELIDKRKFNEIEVTYGDIQDPFSTGNAVKGCQVVFHLASLIAIPYSYQAPQSYVQTNITGAINVMQATREHNVEKIIHTSTSECYGTAQYAPIDENHPLQPQSPYSASKISADMIAESYFRSFGLPVATVRPFNTYGPRQSARAVIPTIITQVLKSEKLSLGSLSPTRDLNFVADTVSGFIKMAEAQESVGQVINIGSGQEISIGALAQKIMKIMDKNVSIISDEERLRPDKSEVERLVCSNQKAKKLLGWEPQHTLTEGLTQTIQWVTTNIHRFKTDIYNV